MAIASLTSCNEGNVRGAALDASWCKQDYLTQTGSVVDAAKILSPESETRLLHKLAELERKTRHQLVVATTPSLQDKPIEEYSVCLARHWRIGRKGIDDGVMLLIAPEERKARIEVGYGLEQFLRDDEAAKIMREAIIPAFESGQFEKGIEAGADQIMREIE